MNTGRDMLRYYIIFILTFTAAHSAMAEQGVRERLRERRDRYGDSVVINEIPVVQRQPSSFTSTQEPGTSVLCKDGNDATMIVEQSQARSTAEARAALGE